MDAVRQYLDVVVRYLDVVGVYLFARNAWGESPCGFDSHHPHAGLTLPSSRAYNENALRVLCVTIPSRKKAAEQSAAFALP